MKSRSIYFLFSKRSTFADFGRDFESVRRLLHPHCSKLRYLEQKWLLIYKDQPTYDMREKTFRTPLVPLSDSPRTEIDEYGIHMRIKACYHDGEGPVWGDHTIPTTGDIMNCISTLPDDVFRHVHTQLRVGNFAEALMQCHMALHPSFDSGASLPSNCTNTESTPSIWRSLLEHWNDVYQGAALPALVEMKARSKISQFFNFLVNKEHVVVNLCHRRNHQSFCP